MNIQIGEQSHELVFNYGTLRRIGELSKKEPFKLVIDYSDPQKVYSYGFYIIYAGLLSAKVKVTQQEVQDAVDEMKFADVIKVITAFNQAFAAEEAEEVPQ